MFLSKYLDDFYLTLVKDNYEDFFINEIDEDNFIKVYNIFKKYNFYFIQDIILAYLDIFTLDDQVVEKGILKLKEKLGNKFVYLVGNNISFLEEIYKEDDYFNE